LPVCCSKKNFSIIALQGPWTGTCRHLSGITSAADSKVGPLAVRSSIAINRVKQRVFMDVYLVRVSCRFLSEYT
jgi:hypothetical protein